MNNSKPRYSTILFDLDGTLIPSLPLWVDAFRYALNEHEQGLTDAHILKRCFYRPWDEIIAEFKIPLSRDAFKLRMHEGLHNAFERAELFDYVVEVLEQCQIQNINLGIVTSSPRTIVEKILHNNKILKYFKSIVTADEVSNFKPHPEPIHQAFAQLKCTAENCIIIGDSTGDILAGHAAGIQTALFFPEEHTKFYDFEHLMSTNPHFVFNNYQDIANHLNK